MQSIKVLVLAALAAIAAMALVGAGPALAESTALCTEDTGACPEAKRISHVHETSVTKATLLGPVEVKCDVLFLGLVPYDEAKKEHLSLGSPLVITGNLTYTNCVRENGKECEVKQTSGGWTVEVLKSGHELTTATHSGEVIFHCGVLINCTYDGENLQTHYLGPLLSEAANGETRLEDQEMHRVKGVCPATAKLDILMTPLEIEVITITKLKTYISG